MDQIQALEDAATNLERGVPPIVAVAEALAPSAAAMRRMPPDSPLAGPCAALADAIEEARSAAYALAAACSGIRKAVGEVRAALQGGR